MSDPIYDKLLEAAEHNKVMPSEVWSVWLRLCDKPGLTKLYERAMKVLSDKPSRDNISVWLKTFFAAGHIAATDLPPILPDASKIVEEMADDLAIRFTDKAETSKWRKKK